MPLQSFDERVTTAMQACKQDRHLSKEWVPLGQIIPRLHCRYGASAPRLRRAGAILPAPPPIGTGKLRGFQGQELATL
jgi:hypothetical protein